jgi:hypothetical protein
MRWLRWGQACPRLLRIRSRNHRCCSRRVGPPVTKLGQSVAVDGAVAVVGSPEADHSGLTGAGSVALFRRAGGVWVEEQVLVAPDAADSQRFGWAVAISGNRVIVGAIANASVFGSAYIFRFLGGVWQLEKQQGADSGAAYVHDVPFPLFLHASPEEVFALDNLTLTACFGTPGKPALLFVTAINGNPFNFKLFNGTFSNQGTWSTAFQVPADPSLPGNDITFRTFSLSAKQKVVQSNDATVAFK